MNLLPIISLLLIAALLMSMLAQARPWKKLNIPGKVIKTMRLNFIQRVIFHRSSLLAIALGLTMGRVSGWLPLPIAVFAGGFAISILLLPMKYTFTTQGIAVGQAIFRPWKEFSHITQKPNQVICEHPSFFGKLTLFVKPVEIERVLAVIDKSHS